MVSRPLESPSILASELFLLWGNKVYDIRAYDAAISYWIDEPEIGDVDEGVVEGGKDTGDAKDEFA